jgi:hypothetical protein
VRRLAPALQLVLLLAAGCKPPVESFPCPGNPVGVFALRGTLQSVSCAGGGPAAGVDALYPAQFDLTGIIAYSSTGDGAALCSAVARAEPLVGTQVADQVDLALDTRGALLGGCSARCAVTVHQRVTGTVQRDAAGAPTGFTGTLLDRATLDDTILGADCAPCTTPCQASYLLLPR